MHSGDVRVDVQAAVSMLAPHWGLRPLIDIDDAQGDRVRRLDLQASRVRLVFRNTSALHGALPWCNDHVFLLEYLSTKRGR